MTDAGEQAKQTTKAIRENAQALGLVWITTPGEVVAGGDPTAVNVLVDGATTPVAAISMIGPLRAGMRVWTQAVPPGALYVVGIAQSSGSRVLLGQLASDSGTVITTTGAEVAATSNAWTINGVGGDGEPSFLFPANRIMSAELVGKYNVNTAAGITRVTIRLRQGQATTSGTELVRWDINHGAQPTIQFTLPGVGGYFKTDNETATFLSLTLERTAGGVAAALTLQSPLVVNIWDEGAVAENVPLSFCATSMV